MARLPSLPKIIVITGPTASGKSACAIKLARKVHGEIISADSRQVYKYLTIGTGKVSKKEMRGIPHYVLDVMHPKKFFTVDDYVRLATHAIDEIIQRNKTPIIVGGTGFYIDALLYENAIPNVPPNPKLRAQLEKYSTERLFTLLKTLDPNRAEYIDRHNPRRLIRALEIVTTTGKPVPTLDKKPRYKAKIIVLKPSEEKLRKAISKRVDSMIEHGLVREIQKLKKLGLSEKRIREFGFEYSLPLDYMKKHISKAEMTEKIKTETWRYAKRQMTYFKKAFGKESRE